VARKETSVRVDPRLPRAIARNPGRIRVQVQRASDPEKAAEALARAAEDILALDGGWESAPGLGPGDANGPKYVSAVTATPAGPVIRIDGGFTPPELLATIPDLIAERLRQAGVAGAAVASPRRVRWPLAGPATQHLDGLIRAVLLHLWRTPSGTYLLPDDVRERVPEGWFEEAVAWVNEGRGPDAETWATVWEDGPFPARDAALALEAVRAFRAGDLVAGDLDQVHECGYPPRVRVARGEFPPGRPPYLCLGAGGPGTSDGELLDAMERLKAVGRRLAPTLGCAAISVQPTFAWRTYGTWYGRFPPGQEAAFLDELGDQLLMDALHWQILTPKHLERLAAGGARWEGSPLTAGPRPVTADRFELAVGEPADWLVDGIVYPPASWRDWPPRSVPRRPDVQRAARDLLRPCLGAEQLNLALIKPLSDEWRAAWEAAQSGPAEP